MRSFVIAAVAALALLAPATALAAGDVFEDVDNRQGSVAPSAGQLEAVSALGASAQWSEFGTPSSLINHTGFLAKGVPGATAEEAARNFVEANKVLFRLGSTDGLALHQDAELPKSKGHSVIFRQQFGGLAASEGGMLIVGVAGASGSWNVAYASSTTVPESGLAANPKLSAQQAWAKAALDVGRSVSLVSIRKPKKAGEWTAFGVNGFADVQRARLVAVPTPTAGVRPAWETLYIDDRGGDVHAFQHFIDAASGAVLLRRDIVEHAQERTTTHPPAGTFTGTMPLVDGACAVDNPAGVVDISESIGSVAAAAEALLTINDVVIHIVRNGSIVASGDTLFSPEVVLYDPADAGQGTYAIRVCDFVDGVAWIPPANFVGQFVFNPASAPGGVPYPPMWKAFPAYPESGNTGFPWPGYLGNDIRDLWCWESTTGAPPGTPVQSDKTGELCDLEVQNLASRAPWDSFPLGVPTFTTAGNNANTSESWSSPLTPGATGFKPVDPDREYIFPFANTWFANQCNPASFIATMEPDLPAAVTNLFAMHNRMHDWSYFLGFTERNWNAQASNFGTGGPGTFEGDPLEGDVQAGAATGGFPGYLGRDNANMVPTPDGVPPITNMYLWQPLAGAFYAPCVDGDYDQAVIGHEYTHLIENRMIGKGGTRGGHHAGAMGESSSDFNAAEYLNEYGFVPVSGENPFSVGAYVTGNPFRGIRNYGMNWPRVGAFPTPGVAPMVDPLNFGDLGYDETGAGVHADGEIWSAVNHDIRAALVNKYKSSFPASNQQVQTACADGKRAPETCPGNRRWIQIYYDAMLLMPVAPSMLDARNAMLATDMMRFGGANQKELWLAFAQRGFGEFAFSTNAISNQNDTDPRPDYSSPIHKKTLVTFQLRQSGNPIVGRVYVGHYEARVSPIADSDPATNAPALPGATNNLDDKAAFVPGTYEIIAHAPGYGHVRQRFLIDGSVAAKNIVVYFAVNVASMTNGATAFGDGTDFSNLIDDTEGTNWGCAPATTPCPGDQAQGAEVIVDLANGTQTFNKLRVSALLTPGQNRFTALRQFEILRCTAAGAVTCTNPTVGFTSIYTSVPDFFPGDVPRPVSPEMLIREFDLPSTTATHVMIRVLNNQCTGQPDFQGEQDMDPLNDTDCRFGNPGSAVPPFEEPIVQVLARRDNEVHIAELQVLNASTAPGGAGGGGGPVDPVVVLTKTGPATATTGETISYELAYTNLGPNASSSAKLVDRLPAGVTFFSAPGCSRSGSTVTCNLGTVAAGSSGTRTVNVRVATGASGTVLVNEAEFVAPKTQSNPAAWTTLVVK